MTHKPVTGILRRLKGLMLRRVHGMITCEEFESYVLRYLDGELPASQQRVFDWHLRVCRECRDYLVAYRRATELGHAVLKSGKEPVPDEVPEDLVKAILAARER